MNIAVFGWYNHRNAGDDRIQYCITRWLDGHTLIFLPAGRKPPLQLLRTCDAAIIGGGGIIMNHGGIFKDMAAWVRSVEIPVALMGVSAEHLTPTLRSELRSFLDLCCFAWFRDHASLEATGDHPKAFVAPDLTWLYPFPVLDAPSGFNTFALCLRRQKELNTGAWHRSIAGCGKQAAAWPLYFEQGGDADLLNHLLPGAPIPDEFSTAPLQNAFAAVSARYHGLLFGIQSGRPVIAASALPKIERFLQEHNLGALCIPEDDPGELKAALEHIERNHSALTEQALSLRDLLTKEAAANGERARQLLLEAASRLPSPNRRVISRLRGALDFMSRPQ